MVGTPDKTGRPEAKSRHLRIASSRLSSSKTECSESQRRQLHFNGSLTCGLLQRADGWFHQGKYYVAYFHLVRARAEQPWRFDDFIKALAHTRDETMRRYPEGFAVSSALFFWADRSCGQKGRRFKELVCQLVWRCSYWGTSSEAARMQSCPSKRTLSAEYAVSLSSPDFMRSLVITFRTGPFWS